MKIKEWMVVKHILFGVCIIREIRDWFVLFDARQWEGRKMSIKSFEPYVTPMKCGSWDILYIKK